MLAEELSPQQDIVDQAYVLKVRHKSRLGFIQGVIEVPKPIYDLPND
jgi:hypothetical protein